MTVPRSILDRVDRVYEFHRGTRCAPGVAAAEASVNPASIPAVYARFPDRPQISLPTSILDIAPGALSVLEQGVAAIPVSFVSPPQNLKTLATWLYLSCANTHKIVDPAGGPALWTRPWLSIGSAYPCEIYVATFAIDGVPPGLYHFSPRQFSLCKLREGPETLGSLKRGRPDLDLLKSVPAAILVTTIFCRSSARFQKRGYRYAVQDAGHAIQAIVTTANGLGIQTLVRLRMNETQMRELIGICPDADYGVCESVQGMVVWADQAVNPMAYTPSPPAALPPIARAPLAERIIAYGSIQAVHEDCVAPGVAIREVRPPLTEMDPMPAEYPITHLPEPDEPTPGLSLRKVMMELAPAGAFASRAIAREDFARINRLTFRGGTFHPLFPSGPHVALVRPFWLVHNVIGLDKGIWYYDPTSDTWALLRFGEFQSEAATLCLAQPFCAKAAAVCFLASSLHKLLSAAGPDLYRLAHLEAGMAVERMIIAATALGLGGRPIGSFYDEPVREFLGMSRSGWEILSAAAIGAAENKPDEAPISVKDQWVG